MEIEKKRETSWKIQLKNTDEYIELTSVEISGEVRLIKFSLLNKNKSVMVELKKKDFFKFLSLISAFKDVVIGEDSILMEKELKLVESNTQKVQAYPKIHDNLYHLESDPSEESIKNKETEEFDADLDEKYWDPW